MPGINDILPETINTDFNSTEYKYLLIIWLRHFGCRFFQEAKVMLPALQEKLKPEGVDILCVVQGSGEDVKVFWPFENIRVLPDPYKKTYKIIGLGRTSFFKIFFPGETLKKRREEATALGCGMNKAGTNNKHSDVLQLPGMVLIDKNRKILWIHRGKETGDLDLGVTTFNLIRDKIHP